MKRFFFLAAGLVVLLGGYGYYTSFPAPGVLVEVYAKNISMLPFYRPCRKYMERTTNANWLAVFSKINKKCEREQSGFCIRRTNFNPNKNSVFQTVLVTNNLEPRKALVEYFFFLKSLYMDDISGCKVSVNQYIKEEEGEHRSLLPLGLLYEDWDQLYQKVEANISQYLQVKVVSDQFYVEEKKEHFWRHLVAVLMALASLFLLYSVLGLGRKKTNSKRAERAKN